MLRAAVFTDGGLILWSQDSQQVPFEELNSIISDKIMNKSLGSEKSGSSFSMENTQYSGRIAHDSHTGTNAAIVWPSMVQLKQADTLVNDINRIFNSVAGPTIQNNRESGLAEDTGLDIEKVNALVKLRINQAISDQNDTPKESTDQIKVDGDSDEIIDAASEPQTSGLRDTPPVKGPRRRGGSKKKAPVITTEKEADKKKSKKKMRNWDGIDHDDNDSSQLDYSVTEETGNFDDATAGIDKLSLDNYGQKSKNGFLIKELDSILSKPTSEKASTHSEPFGFLKNITGGKTLSDSDLDAALSAMEDHLVNKNVTKEVANVICNQVRKDLVGTSTKSWTSVKATVKASVTRQLKEILTPSTSTDLLRDIRSRKKAPRPYVISVVGVNGVGKSTNLGKIAFWLLQNDFKVLIAACDTFRSGAVEQLKVHVQRLKQLTEREGHGKVDIFDQGYGKDAAVIAKRAIEHGQKAGFDVVLIDTAGRRHNDDRLMSSLEKFGNLAEPDKIVMVGEALVGTDSVEQARSFDAAFGRNRGLDFFLVSKCDTVGDMLGTLVNITFATGVPVLFVGVGQQYTDLRTLSIEWALNLLLA